MSSRDWMEHGAGVFFDTLRALEDHELDQDTVLPGWTRRHVVAHVHFNALALSRLARWASTGQETRMYASQEQRAQEIAYGAGLPIQTLRDLVQTSDMTLRSALDALSPDAWNAQVVTAQGRTVPASEIVWMRTRELYVHAVDLAGEATFDDVPEDALIALIVDVVRRRTAAGEGAALAAWITGRERRAPELTDWL